MATILRAVQSSREIRTHTISFANDLPAGVTVSSAAVVHTGPSTETPSVAVSSPNVNVTLDTPAVGTHYLDVLATLSNAEKSQAFLIVKVDL